MLCYYVGVVEYWLVLVYLVGVDLVWVGVV